MSYKTYNLIDFNTQIKKKTHVDTRFQRRLAWPVRNKTRYLQSVMRGHAESPMMIYDIESGQAHCEAELDRATTVEVSEEYLKDLEGSLRYFKGLRKKGYRYVSIDGQHRTDTIGAFLENNVNIQGIVFKAFNNAVVNLKKKTFYEDLDLDIKNYIDMNPCVDIKIIQNRTYGELTEAFITENDGLELKLMEKTSAILSRIGDYVHSLSERYEQTFRKIHSNSCNWLRKEDQDWITKVCKLVSYDSKKNTKVDGHAEYWRNEKLSQTEKRNIEDILDNLQAVVATGEKFSATWKLWAVVMCLYELNRDYSNFEISNYGEFTNEVIDHVEQLRAISGTAYSTAVTDWHKGRKSGTEPKNSSYLHHWITNSDVASSRNKWAEHAFGKTSTFFGELISKGIIIQTSSSSILDDVEELAAAAT